MYVAWAKLFKYLSFNKTMSQLNGTLSATAADLSGFLVMFVIIYMAFVQLGYLLFGIQVNFPFVNVQILNIVIRGERQIMDPIATQRAR